MTMMVSTMSYAKSNNGKGNGQNNSHKEEHLKGYEKNLKNFVEIDGKRIKVKGRHVNFDTPPVIKEGRTLIPVRAITEAMGGLVEWNSDDFIATIISPDGQIRIDFYLKDLYKEPVDDEEPELDVAGGTIIIYDLDGEAWVKREELGRTDVLPGLINNRTFVPLRFISETFGLKVGYDADTGEIDIEDPEETGLSISPKSVTYTNFEDIKAKTTIEVITDGYSLDSIDGLTYGSDYTIEVEVVVDVTTQPSLIIKLDDSYIEGLDEEETVLDINFEKDGNVEVKNFTINLPYNEFGPKISPKVITFDTLEEVEASDVATLEVITDGYSLVSIDGLTWKTDYEFQTLAVADVTTQASLIIDINTSYISDLEDEENELSINFIKGLKEVTKIVKIVLEYN